MTVIFNAVKNFGAKEFTDKLSERVTAGQADRKEKWKNGEIKILTGLLPAWLEIKDGKICPVKSASGSGKMRKIPASVVVAVFRLAAQGYGAPKILRQLNSHGLTMVWINKTLRNRAVLGEFISKGEITHNYYPRIIDETLWQAARAAIDSHNRITTENRKRCVLGRSSDANLFPGLVFDVTTPGKEFSLWYQRRGVKGIFLVTNTAQAGKGEVHRIRYDRFERAFIRIMSALDWQGLVARGDPPELTTALVRQTELTNEVASLQSLINVRRTALDAAADMEAVNQTAASLKRLEDKQAILKTELESVTAEIDAARAKLASLENPQALLDILDQPEKRAQLRLEIAKRISKIEVFFGPQPCFMIHFGALTFNVLSPVDEGTVLPSLPASTDRHPTSEEELYHRYEVETERVRDLIRRRNLELAQAH